MKNLFIALNFILLISCANEKPISSFEFKQDADGAVTFINNSTNAISYQWDFGDGSFDTSMQPEHKFERNGKYNVKLAVTNGTDSHHSIITINITNVELAKYLFWTKKSKYNPIEIYVGGVLYGTVKKAFSAKPDCESLGSLTVALPAGKYTFSAKGKNGIKWDESDLRFEKGQCKSLELY